MTRDNDEPNGKDIDFKAPPENREKEKINLKERWGVSFSSRNKDKKEESLANQLASARELDLKELQIDLKGNRPPAEIADQFAAFKNASPETHLSLHSETPQIEMSDLSIKNKNKLESQIDLSKEIGSDIFTIHPPKISEGAYKNLPPDQQERLLKSYSSFLAEAIKNASDQKKPLTMAVENLPAKGKEGNWGQKIEEIKAILDETSLILAEEHRLPQGEINKRLGLTLDVNHALFEQGDQGEILRKWFEQFKERIKCLHVYAPQEPNPSFESKLSQAVKLCQEFQLNIPLYLESKQDAETTKKVFAAGKENPEF